MKLDFICRDCGNVGRPITKPGINWLIAIVLLLILVLPGLIYIIWEAFSSQNDGSKVCKSCNSHRLVSVNSPLGKKLLKEFDI